MLIRKKRGHGQLRAAECRGYDAKARFLDYCDSLQPGFVAQLNAKLKDGYSEDYFLQILGKNVQQLWQDYKTKYGG